MGANVQGVADDSPLIPVSIRSGGSKRRATQMLAGVMDTLSALRGDDKGAESALAPTTEQ